MKIQPIGKNIIISPDREEKTKFGIILPDSAEEKPDFGIVVARGPDVHPVIKENSRVMFKKYAPDEVEFDGVKYLVCEESDILAIINEG